MRPSRVLRLGAAALLSLVLTAAIVPIASAADPNEPSTGPSSAGTVAATRVSGPLPSKAKVVHAGQPSVVLPALGTYSISGTVTARGGGPLANITVRAYSHASMVQVATDQTAANGTYTLAGLPTDDYVVWFQGGDNTYFRGAYSGGGVPEVLDKATVVSVTNANVGAINAQLQKQAPWSIWINVGPSSAAIGSPVRITAMANQDVELTYFYVMIYRSDDPTTPRWSCDTGSICYVDDTLGSAGSWTYTATVAEDAATPAVASSSPVTANWITSSTYHAISPKRILDSRDGTGGLSGPFTNHVARTFQVTGSDPSGVPAGATAVTGNLTVTGQTSNGYLFIGPDAMNNPTSSTLNFPRGDDRANAVTVALSATGSLSITFVAPTNGPTAHAIFDVTGYFTADSTGATYHALAPARLLDTRDGTGGLTGPFGNHVARTFQVSGGSSPVPAGAIAVTGNLTVTSQSSNGYFFIGPVATNDPTSSTLNFPRGDDRANAVTVALGAGGTLSITFVAPYSGPTADAIFDVTGYFTADGTGARYVALAPKRLLDTRDGTGGVGTTPFANHVGRTFLADMGVPPMAVAVTGNLTVTAQTSNGYLFMGPALANNPTSSTLNFPRGDDRANAVTVAVGTTTTSIGPAACLSITFVAPTNGPTAHAIFDVTGYFVPQSA